MLVRSNFRPYGCPVEATLDVIGGRWKGVILFHLLEGKRRFGELRRLLPGITQRMLTLQLRELEADGVIHREVYKEIPPRVEYSLTEFGQSLRPILLLMLEWGRQYDQQIVRIKNAHSGEQAPGEVSGRVSPAAAGQPTLRSGE